MKVAYVEKTGSRIIIGGDISIPELLECDIILWNQLGCHILIPKENVANAKQLVIDYQQHPHQRKLPPELYFEWPPPGSRLTNAVSVVWGTSLKASEPSEEVSDPPSAGK